MRFLSKAFAIAAILVGGIALSAPAFAETELSDPKPSWDNPRLILLQITDSDEAKINNIFYNAVNLQKFYGIDMVKIAIVAYSGGVRPFLAETSTLAERVSSLQQYDVEFVICGNTLETMHKGEADLLPGVTVVSAGIAEIVERQLKGWAVIVP